MPLVSGLGLPAAGGCVSSVLPMDYHVARNNEKLGVFADAEARARFRSGEIRPTDLVWCEGMPAWRAASEVLAGAPPVSPPPTNVAAPAVSSVAGPFAAKPHPPKPDSYLVWAVLSTLLCCVPLGIVAIVFAAQVDSKYAVGDFTGAQIASGRAKLWSILSAGSLCLLVALYLAAIAFFGAVGVLGGMAQ